MSEWINPYTDLEDETPLEAALGYAAMGVPVFPCGLPGKPKAPKTPRGLYDATTDPTKIRAWWTQWPDASIGARTGAASGWTAFDVDPRNGGDHTFDSLMDESGHGVGWTDTRTHVTGSGGLHLIFKHDPRVTRCRTELLPGIDIKDDGGYVIVPPSQPSGFGRYMVKTDDVIAEQPEWLIELRRRCGLEQDSKAAQRAESRGDAMQSELESIANMIASEWKNGVRNTLNMAAAAYLYTKGYTAHDVETVMDRVYAISKDEDASNRRDNVRRTIARIDERQSVVGASYLYEKFPTTLAVLDALTERSNELKFKDASAVMDEPPPTWVVDQLIAADCITMLVAESTVGKTFTSLFLASAIGSGATWCGRETKRGSVAYITWEGDAMGLRLKALATRHRTDHIYLLRFEKPITPVDDAHGNEGASVGELEITRQIELLNARLAENGEPPIAAVFIDTYRAASRGGENDDDKVAATLRAARRLLGQVPGAAMVVIHHTGWQDGEIKRRRERGSSVFRGNVDSTLYLETTGDDQASGTVYIRMKTLKERDAESGKSIYLARQTVVVGTDARGRELTSCVVFPDPRTTEDRIEEERQKEEAKVAFALRAILTAVDANPSISNRRDLRSAAHVGALLFDKAMQAATRLVVKVGKNYSLTDEGRASLGLVTV